MWIDFEVEGNDGNFSILVNGETKTFDVDPEMMERLCVKGDPDDFFSISKKKERAKELFDKLGKADFSLEAISKYYLPEDDGT